MLYEGETITLNATISPANADNSSVVWSTSDENIASVDADGHVTAISQGTVMIVVTTNDGGFTDTTLITIEKLENADFESILYPNPTKGLLNIDLRRYPSAVVRVMLFNGLRQKLAARVFDVEHGDFEVIDVTALSDGVYYISFESGAHREAKAFIVSR
jgi:hypothetical protein